jgi:predicted P-loop ATPase
MKQQLKMQMSSMRSATSVEEVKAMLDTTEKGGVRNSIKNCLTVFQHDPLLSGAIAYNLLTDRTDIVKPIGYDRSPSSSMTDTDMKYIRLYLEENYDLTSEKKIIDAADLAAHQNSYHPVRDYLNSLAWDGTERIRYCLHHFLGAEADEYTFQALRLFLLGAIHRAFRPGCKFEVMLCLVGGQGAGKSTFFRLLAGKDEWFSDDLRKLDDENVYRKLQGHWIIEMSEMIATANAKSIEEIKSFLSRQKEVYKIPYETHPADRLRQCVFGGTSNAMDFLPLDRSGNRRFLPVQVCPEQAEVHILEDEAASRVYLQQVWAEAMTIYRAGGWKLTFSPEMVRYWKVTKKRLKDEGNETVTACNQLKMTASDGKKRLTDVADTEQLLRIIQSIPSPKAEPFKLWLAQVGRERIEETIDPELTIDRALETYLKKGYSREWINQRLQAIQVRKELTDEWDARGVQKGVEYAILTDEISRAWSGMSTRQYKNLKGLKKENLRDNMTTLELVLNMLAEATTTQFSRDRKPTTFQENLAVAKAGGQVAGRTRKDIESQSDTPVITAKNAAQLNQVVTDLLEGAVSDTTEESKDK